jgi:hypothetical protein
MTAGWVAADVRGRSLLGRAVGSEGCTAIAGAESWPAAREMLRATALGRGLPVDADRLTARRHVTSAAAWQLRVLAGWLPPGAIHLGRIAIGPMELADIERHLARLRGADPPPPLELGSLGGVARRVLRARAPAEVRAVLARSVWGDPGGDEPATIGFGLRAAWLRRVAALDGVVTPWALGALTVLVAREQFAFERTIADRTAREIDRLIGHRWREASDPADLAARVGDAAGWSVEGIGDAGELWRAEVHVLDRVERDARAAGGRPASETTVIAVFARLLVDLWRVTAAIEAVGYGDVGPEVLDAVAA